MTFNYTKKTGQAKQAQLTRTHERVILDRLSD